jgi:serine/threonine protein kinase
MKKFYLIEHKIGTGSYGHVYAAKCKKTGVKVAIKHIQNFSKYEYDSCKIVREIKI